MWQESVKKSIETVPVIALSCTVYFFVLQALQYFEQLKSSADGWKLCAQALSSGTYEG